MALTRLSGLQPGRLALAALALTLVACAQPPLQPTVEFAPVHPVVPVREANFSGSLFVDGRSNFFGRQRDYQVGDIVTVILSESTQA